MMPFTRHTLKKAERLSSKTGLTALLSKGKWGVQGPLRYCCLPDNGQEQARIVGSVGSGKATGRKRPFWKAPGWI